MSKRYGESAFLLLRELPRTVEEAAALARQRPSRQEEVSGQDLIDGSIIYLFARRVREGDVDGAAELAAQAFELGKAQPGFGLTQKDWVQLLIDRGRLVEADRAALQQAEFLASGDTQLRWTVNWSAFWCDFLQPLTEQLPQTAELVRRIWPTRPPAVPSAASSRARKSK